MDDVSCERSLVSDRRKATIPDVPQICNTSVFGHVVLPLEMGSLPYQSINQSINQSLFANAISQINKKKCGRLPEQAIAQQSWPP